jgi:hypothetical protein
MTLDDGHIHVHRRGTISASSTPKEEKISIGFFYLTLKEAGNLGLQG